MNRVTVSLKMDGKDALVFTAEDGFSLSDSRSMTAEINQTVRENINGEVTISFNTFVNQSLYDIYRDYALNCWNNGKTFSVHVKYIAAGVVNTQRIFARGVCKDLNPINDFDKGGKVMMKVNISANKEEGVKQYTSLDK